MKGHMQTTFRDAMLRCESRGGEMTDGEYVLAVEDGVYVEKNGKSFRPGLDDILNNSQWIYQAPLSAFQEWHKNHKSTEFNQSSPLKTARKEGWNAAIDAVKKVPFKKPLETHEDWIEEIEKLKEP